MLNRNFTANMRNDSLVPWFANLTAPMTAYVSLNMYMIRQPHEESDMASGHAVIIANSPNESIDYWY